MTIRRHSKNYNFIADTKTGATYRWGKTINENPYCAPWPELADISISNHCSKNCEFCYRDSNQNNSFISVDNYELILKSLNHKKWGNVFQVAIGGGEPLEHPDFIDIINKTVEYGVIPNFTTNGYLLNDTLIKLIKNKIGAIAVSENSYEEIKEQKHKILIQNKIKTNIHFVLDNNNLETAIKIILGEYNNFLTGINGIIFLTFKPAGRAQKKDCLIMDETLKKFIELIDSNKCSAKIGFDACFVPLLIHLTNTNIDFIDSCECAYFSVYIDEQLNVKPCSFADNKNYAYNLKEYSFDIIWQEKFAEYRRNNNNFCKTQCTKKEHCRGKCYFFEEINLCYS